MKKKLFIFAFIAALMVCLLAITASAKRVEDYDDTFTLRDSVSIVHYEKWYYNEGSSYVRKAYTDTVTVSFKDEQGNALTEVAMWEYDEEEGKYYSLVWYISDYELTWEDQTYTDDNVGTQTYPKYTTAKYTLSKVRALDLRYYTYDGNRSNSSVPSWTASRTLKVLDGIYLPAGDPDDINDDIKLQDAVGIGRDNDNYGYVGYDAQFAATGNKIVVGNFRDCDFECDMEGNYGTSNTWSRADNLQCLWYPDTMLHICGGIGSVYEVDFGDGMEIIACQILRENKRVKEIKLPNSLLYLNNEAFRGSDLTSLTIGEGLMVHGGSPFLYTGGSDIIYISKNSLTALTSNISALISNTSATIYFDGTLADANTLMADIIAESSSYNGKITLVDYNTTKERGDVKNVCLFYNYNRCDAFYFGTHEIIDDNNCTTLDVCTRACGVTGSPAQAAHNDLITYKYDNGFTATGIHSIVCQNAGCEVKSITEKAPLFTAKGYSLSPNGMAISGGYTINIENLPLYEQINGNITYGIVIANSKTFGGGTFFNDENKVNSQKALQVEIDSQYTNFDCSVNFGTPSNSTLHLVICAYVIDANGVTFIQADAGDVVESTDISGGSFKSVTLDKVIALVPTSSNDEE